MAKTSGKKRSPRWTEVEMEALVSAIEKNIKQILGSFSTEITAASKKQAWRVVTTQVNSVNISGVNRTVEQVEHKWWDLKTAAKKSISEWKRESTKTGGGVNKAIPPTDLHYKIVDLIGQQSVYGIKGASSLESGQSSLLEIQQKDIDEAPACQPIPFSYSTLDNSLFEIMEEPISPASSFSEAATSQPRAKRSRSNQESEIVSVQKEILLQVSNIALVLQQQLEQMIMANSLKREKLQSKVESEGNLSSSQPFSFGDDAL